MFDRNESVEITRNLLIALGIDIQESTNTLIYQDTKSPISFEGKAVKANNDINKSLYISEYDIKLEPLDPKCTKLVERLFSKFLDDSSAPDMQIIPEVLVYFFDKNDEDGTYRVCIKYEDGTRWVGNWYINKILCYIEAIFNIDGTFADTDLRKFDIKQSDMEESIT